ncbi:MAG: DciA family protein [Candidatus Nanopelagicales bacterium]
MNLEKNFDAAKQALNRAKRRSVSGVNSFKKRAEKNNNKNADFLKFKEALEHLIESHNWKAHTKIATLLEKWDQIIGVETAQHVLIKNYDELTKELLLSADSHTWAVQLRTLTNKILEKINQEIGENFVTRVKVVGPSKSAQKHQWRAPSMNKFYDQF